MAQTDAVFFKEYVEEGLPTPDHFILKSAPRSEPQEGEVEVELVYVSVDPYMRARMRSNGFMPPFALDQPMEGGCVGVISNSRNPDYAEGTYVVGNLQWKQAQVVPATALGGLQKISSEVLNTLKASKTPLSTFVGALGMTGFSAWSALEKIGKPKAGETVFVSGAAGAVGVIVGQLCKHVYGCKVFGVAGSDEKVAFLKERGGYDDAFNYKTTSYEEGIKRLCPGGIDVFFDNVGGEALEAVIDNCNVFARVMLCGAISQYNVGGKEQAYGIRTIPNMVSKRILMQGFFNFDWTEELMPQFMVKMPQYIKEGKVHDVEQVEAGGLARVGQAFVDMMKGKNLGKMVVQVGPDPYRA